MFLRSLRVTNFRNIIELDIELPPQGAIFHGNNGQGKTNFLEAIYYLSLFRSFRGSKDDQLIYFGKDFFRIVGEFQSNGGDTRIVETGYDGRTKKVKVDGLEERRISNTIGKVKVVVVSPEDILILQSSPQWRRRFLDILLSLSFKKYITRLQKYRSVLTQRNKLLRDGLGDRNYDVLIPWDEQLVEIGSYLIYERLKFVKNVGQQYAKYYELLSGNEKGSFSYESSIDPESAEQIDEITAETVDRIRNKFNKQLASKRDAERNRRQTLVGPHLDDLIFTSDGRNMRLYGSQGQQRTAAIVLRMVEGSFLKKISGTRPTYLLDDVFAELDIERSSRLLSLIEDGSQILITSPKESEVVGIVKDFPKFEVHSGEINKL